MGALSIRHPTIWDDNVQQFVLSILETSPPGRPTALVTAMSVAPFVGASISGEPTEKVVVFDISRADTVCKPGVSRATSIGDPSRGCLSRFGR